MTRQVDHLQGADEAIRVLTAILEREGSDAAAQAAKAIIEACTAWLAREHGPDEARRILRITGAAQGEE